jgi:hypothetical protein
MKSEVDKRGKSGILRATCMHSPPFLPLRRILFSLLLMCAAFLSAARAAEPRNLSPGPIPEQLRAEFQLAPFYQKFVNVDGFPSVPGS